jgi:hypothetical protein
VTSEIKRQQVIFIYKRIQQQLDFLTSFSAQQSVTINNYFLVTVTVQTPAHSNSICRLNTQIMLDILFRSV